MSFQNISDISRPLANFTPSVWGSDFLSYQTNSQDRVAQISERLQHLKRDVKHLLDVVQEPLEKLKLIDSIQRLGVSYHFENEIETILRDIYENHYSKDNHEDDTLFNISLKFRLFRQQGYTVSCGVFEKLRNEKGEFNMSLIDDILGMLNLYEASHLAIHGEEILDQALDFTTFHLQSRLSDMRSDHKEKVTHALKWPLHKTMPRLTARYNIALHSNDGSRNELLLEFAALDFNILQVQHQEELSHLTKWWQELRLVTKLPYARDRIVEAYIFALGAHFEPQYGIGRLMECKLTSITGVLDDTYDAYATIEELELITKAIQRWNTSPLDSLPNQSMKVVVDALIELLAGIELMMAQDGKSCLIQYIKGAVQSLSKSYMIEAIWRNEGIIPTYEEYQDNGFVSSAYPLLQISFFLFLRKFATKEVFDWFSNKNIPKIVKASSLLARLMNDVASYKFESERGTVVSAVECCIKQYGIFEEESHKLLLKEIQNHWKDINEDCITPNMVSRPVLEVILNFTRVLSVMYENNEDRYTHGELLKDHVTLLFLDPIVITH